MDRLPRHGGMFLIEIGESSNYRPARVPEDEAIREHIQEYPKCNGSEIRDYGDKTLLILTPRLRCMYCRVNVKVRGGSP